MSIGFISLILVLLGIKYWVFWFSLFRSRPFGIRHWHVRDDHGVSRVTVGLSFVFSIFLPSSCYFLK